jgi:HD-GYP domain-containing protein (c-di-GMP phosphodiesterase class II)
MPNQWRDILTPAILPYAVPGLIAVLVGLLLLLFIQRREAKKRSEMLAYTQRILKLIQPEAGLENNLNLVLEVIGSIIDTHAYAFYAQDSKQNYVLKAVRHRRQDPGQVAPSYSGLAPYEKEAYLPPLSVKIGDSPVELGFIREGEVPLFQMLLSGGKGLIRIGPIARIRKRQMNLLFFTGELLPQIVNVLIESERLKIKVEVVETSSVALHTVSSMAMDTETVIRKSFGMAASALGMSGGCLLMSEAGSVSIPSFFGWSKETERRLSDSSSISLLIQMIGTKDMSIWNKEDSVFEQAVSLLGNRNDRLMMAGRLPFPGKTAWFVCGFPSTSATDLTSEQLRTSLQMMIRELSVLLGLQHEIRSFGQTYADFLKMLAGTIDNLNPYTVGYSEMTSRYAIIIAKEMGLPHKQIRSVGLAAHLSNIGVLGLSEALYLKEGKFTEIEFEKMKLHAEVGAAIVEMTVGDQEVADYIRYHHERMDGNGYPNGLRGDEIPVGARIISVVQTFLAKINGRKYREPLSFDKAVQLLESLAGVQLDEKAVRAFVGWLNKKRSSPTVKGKSLGPCWEMCCAPAEVCRTCPAFGKPQAPCWEAGQNNCQAHGKSCETCFVYTETKSRSGVG